MVKKDDAYIKASSCGKKNLGSIAMNNDKKIIAICFLSKRVPIFNYD